MQPLPSGPCTLPPLLQLDSCQPLCPLQEMLAIVKSIYDMMGRHTYPLLREDAPLEHVERFFQVSAPAWICGERQWEEALAQGIKGKQLHSLSHPLPQEG